MCTKPSASSKKNRFSEPFAEGRLVCLTLSTLFGSVDACLSGSAMSVLDGTGIFIIIIPFLVLPLVLFVIYICCIRHARKPVHVPYLDELRLGVPRFDVRVVPFEVWTRLCKVEDMRLDHVNKLFREYGLMTAELPEGCKGFANLLRVPLPKLEGATLYYMYPSAEDYSFPLTGATTFSFLLSEKRPHFEQIYNTLRRDDFVSTRCSRMLTFILRRDAKYNEKDDHIQRAFYENVGFELYELFYTSKEMAALVDCSEALAWTIQIIVPVDDEMSQESPHLSSKFIDDCDLLLEKHRKIVASYVQLGLALPRAWISPVLLFFGLLLGSIFSLIVITLASVVTFSQFSFMFLPLSFAYYMIFVPFMLLFSFRDIRMCCCGGYHRRIDIWLKHKSRTFLLASGYFFAILFVCVALGILIYPSVIEPALRPAIISVFVVSFILLVSAIILFSIFLLPNMPASMTTPLIYHSREKDSGVPAKHTFLMEERGNIDNVQKTTCICLFNYYVSLLNIRNIHIYPK